MMTGGAITARQALDWGLLWRLLPEATLVDEVIRLAERLARVFPYCHKQLDDPSVGIRPREESVSRRARPSGPSHNGARFAPSSNDTSGAASCRSMMIAIYRDKH
jgi:enoyl-CoA hydratase/carnithine racemase